MRLEVYIHRLEVEQNRLAREAMENPGRRGEFDYGRAVGMYAGIEHAKNVLLEMHAEKERQHFEL